MYCKVFNETQREIVWKVVWPITKESIKGVTDNTYLYTRKQPVKNWVINEDDEDEDFIQLSFEEYDILQMNEKYMYLDGLGEYLDFDPSLAKRSEYNKMTKEEKEEYEIEMRWMASPDFEKYLYYQDLDDDEIEALPEVEYATFKEIMEEEEEDKEDEYHESSLWNHNIGKEIIILLYIMQCRI